MFDENNQMAFTPNHPITETQTPNPELIDISID